MCCLHFRYIFSCGTDASLSCHVLLNGKLTLDHTVPMDNEMLSLALNAQVHRECMHREWGQILIFLVWNVFVWTLKHREIY